MNDEIHNEVFSDIKLGFFMVKNSVIENYDLTVGAFWLYCCLSKFAYGKSECFPSIATLAKLPRVVSAKRGVSEQAIRNWTSELVQAQLISVKYTEAYGNTYRLLDVSERRLGGGQLQLRDGGGSTTVEGGVNRSCVLGSTTVDPNNTKEEYEKNNTSRVRRKSIAEARPLHFSGIRLLIDIQAHEAFKVAYEGVDLEVEYRKMDAWLVANKRNYRAFGRFANSWLGRCSMSLGQNGGGGFVRQIGDGSGASNL